MNIIFKKCYENVPKILANQALKYCTSKIEQMATKFELKKVLVLTKTSKYDFEKNLHTELNEKQLENLLRSRGSDFSQILYHHYIHKGVENTVLCALEAAGIETRLNTRFDYSEENIDWSDAIFTAGGDGTFLLAATKILDNKKPVIGFNSDPLKSEGHLCLPKKYSVDIRKAVDRLINGRFKWTFRRRIRVTLFGDDIFEAPVELNQQKLRYPEFRYLDIDSQINSEKTPNLHNVPKRTLPVLALNEIFIGECVSARVSNLEITFDDKEKVVSKCSGLIASTGTGSTSWTYSVNRLQEQTIEDVLSIVKEETKLPLNDQDQRLVNTVTNKFNQLLIINPEEPRMVYTIRDLLRTLPLLNKNDPVRPRGFARRIGVKSRCFDASLVIDGGISFKFNDGTSALLEVLDKDALKTVTMIETPEPPSFKH